MRKFVFSSIAIVWVSTLGAQTIQSFQLDNGLTVILDANPRDKHVFGSLVINVGSADEEPDATGVAHYLEHMLFKGTSEMGTTDWEKEKIHYEKIINLYQELQKTKSADEAKAVNKKINDEVQNQSQYIVPNEFSLATQHMGGKGLNASTSFEITNYYNAFPSNQIEKWLKLYAHRFSNPVFRLFQTELETVYEEKNRSSDNLFMDFIYKNREILYGAESPFARKIIGKTDHLKKPSMQAMIDFFEKWYVPNNMALILSGKFDVKTVKPLVEKYFGGFKRKALPERRYSATEVPSKKVKEKVNLTPYLIGIKNYVFPLDVDFKSTVAIDVIRGLLSNGFSTGFLDKLRIDGDVITAGAFFDESKISKTLQIQYTPKFDINQFRQESLNFTEKMIMEAIDKVIEGNYEDQFLENIKTSIVQGLERTMETPSNRVNTFTFMFYLNKKMTYISDYINALKSIDKTYLSEFAKKHLTKNHITVNGEIGKNNKDEKIEKPELDPIKFPTTGNSTYLKTLIASNEGKMTYEIFNTKNVSISPFQDKIDLHYMKNQDNRLFRLVILFGAGNKEYPKLRYATGLLNNAGVLNQYTSDELRKKFGDLNVSYSFQSDDYHTYIVMQGYEEKLAEACQLLSRLMLIPEVTEKSLDGIIGRVLNGRAIEKKSIATVQEALVENILYGDKSEYIDRLSNSDVISLSPSELTGVFNDAISHEAKIFYYGRLGQAEVKNILSKNLAFSANRKDRILPIRKALKKHNENTIFLVNEPKAKQAHIHLFIESEKIPLEEIPKVEAFNQYFSGSFNGLVIKEIREYRALAYAAGAVLSTPIYRDWTSILSSYVGTQADKTAQSVEVLVGLIQDMPQYPDRMLGVKNYLKNGSEVEAEDKFSFLIDSYNWSEMGYDGNPLDHKLPLYNQLNFEDVIEVYQKMIKNKKYAIGIVGKLSDIDQNNLKSQGKIVKVNKNSLFSE